ncbi:hypothetical protein MHN79_16440, partial [Vibrio sp. Of14-4]|nr:hypothetical protein [Vibrio sp. Of14-4]
MMLSFNPFKKSLFIILTLLLISSCGGGGGGGDSAPRSRTQGTITGVVFDAPVSGASVEIYEYKNGSLGRKLGSDITSASGHYSIDIESASMPLYISAKGGGYEDPFSGNAVYGSKGKPVYLASVTNYTEGSTQNVMVTPLTYLVTGLTEYRIKQGRSVNSAITTSTKDLSELYGFDVSTTQPVDLTLNVTSNVTNGHKYGAVLTAYSSYAWEFLKPNPDEGKDTYTSLHLADLGYQDITFDGKLNGRKRDEGGQFSEDVEFGSKATLDADFYTHIIAQHIMSAVSNPEINRTTGYQDFADFIKSPSFDQYKAMADELSKVNGSNENPDEIFPQRYTPGEQPPSIDDMPPTVDYPKEGDVLAGQDIIALNLVDNVGIASARVVVKYTEDKQFDSWTELLCPFGQENAQLNCWVDDSNFTVGKREASLTVHLNTEALGDGNTNSDSDAKLLVYLSDIINQSEEEVSVDIKWDNSAPVIVVTSAESVNSLPTDYLLTGYVKKDPQLLEDRSVWIALSSGEYSKYSCSNYPSGSAIWCGFSYTESGLNFDQSVAFSIRAKDIYGNQGNKEFILYQDVTAPKVSLTYPDAQFNFQRLEGESFPSIYESSTYTKENVEDATKYLLIDYDYASKGARQVFSDLDLTKLENPDVFQRNSLPYVTLTISDENGTSADNLKVTVEYYSKRRGEAEFILRGTRVQTASEVTADNVYFPFNLNKDNDSFLPSMTLYIPFSRDAFKDEFAKALSSDIQKLRITVEDAAGNLSYNKEATGGNQGTLIEAFFRSTFDKPVVTVVSPFSNARVVLAGLNASTGAFNLIKTCDAALGDEGKDIVKCLLTREQEREFYKVYLDDFSASGEPHYFQWSKDIKTLVDLSYEILGDDIDGDKVPVHSFSAYFSPSKDTTVYITEFASYHAGLFDSQWNNLESGNKTAVKAKEILSQVNNALATQSDSMLGFDPVSTPYASTKELDEEGVPAKLASKHIYRFLLEGLTELANANYATSVDYAKAFYRDLSKDGKADGQGSIYDDQGNESTGQIILSDSGKELGPDTYRKDLAEAYYRVAASYDVERKDALNQADHFAKANPIYADDNVFNQEGSSIDNTPPSISVQPNEQQSEGAFFGDGSNYTISGKIESKVTITDDKTTVKINEGDFTVFWVDPQGTEHEATDTKFERSDDSTEYTETYNFVINSKSDKYREAKQFNIVVKAQDSIGNFDSQTFVYLVDNQIPVIKRVTVDPEFPVVDTEAEFTVEFEEPVTLEPGTVKIGGAEISFENPQEYRTVWQSSARVSVEANKESTQLTIDSSYFDRVRNQGTEGYEHTIFVEPLITIDNVTENNEVNAEEDDVKHVVISGTTKGFKRTAQLTVNLVSDKEDRKGADKFSDVVILESDGRWKTNPINMSTWEYSEFTVTVSGKYAEGERSVVATKKALYDDKIKPEVVSTLISYDGEESENVLLDDKSAKVTLTFNERVTTPTASLNGQAISFEETSFSKVWVGTTQPLMLPSGSATAPLIVVEGVYQDTRPQGNLGEGYTTHIPLKPVITLNDMGDSIKASDATEFIVSGTSKGFQTGAELTVTVKNKPTSGLVDQSNLPQYSQTIPVDENGDWQTEQHDISDWYQGTIIITVTGENSAGQSVTLTDEVVYEDDVAPELRDIELTTGTPTHDTE